ncbi:MAG: Fe-S cluster assembly protein HesB [Pyrinomonadaceae bacterium]|nr:Fe-S cluster assembly protein HesB [Pyrinomonadaceae bacterium]
MEIRVPVTHNFSFKRTALSHGWCELLPFEFEQEGWRLLRVIDLGAQRPVSVSITGAKQSLVLNVRQGLGKRAAAKVVQDVRHMLRLDEDLTEFYSAMSADDEFAWIERQGAGRLLRSPTVFEDVVKAITTTNCSWALTVKMVTGLVQSLGLEAADGRRSFPTPQAMAEAPLQFYTDVMRAGYRAPYFKELAERVACGELDVEGWLSSDLPTPALKREMKQVKGVGDYAADTLLRLIGRYDGLALDSWVRGKFARVRGRGRAATDEKIARYYSRFREWRGLALWCDMTRDWLEEEAAV